MINLTVKLRAFELTDLSWIIKLIRLESAALLHEEDYFHFYNMESLFKRCFDKQFTNLHKRKNGISLTVNINEYKSLKVLYDMVVRPCKGDKMLYYHILMQRILSDLHKKQTNLPAPGYLSID